MKFYSDIAAPQFLCHEPHRAGPEERIEDKIPGTRRCLDARLYGRQGERRKMSAVKPLRVNVPYRAAIAAVHFYYGFGVVVVTLFLREHEQVLVCPGWPVLDTFRHRIRLVPHRRPED